MDKNITKNIQKNIKFYRNQHKLTQEQLANLIGGKKSLVSNYENGHSVPDIFVLYKLAKIFDTTVDDLISDN
ncbi:MAG: helix-turn-helix transcriptional regulator [Bacillota bacterium]